MRETKLPPTPLQKVVGFNVAEEIYDELPFTTQIIIDLRIEGLVLHDIAAVFEQPYTTIADNFYRARHYMAMQKFKAILENRQHYRENHPIVARDRRDEEDADYEDYINAKDAGSRWGK